MDNLPDETTQRENPASPELASANDLTRPEPRSNEAGERFAVIARMREAFTDVPAEDPEHAAERSVAAARERRKRASDPPRSSASF